MAYEQFPVGPSSGALPPPAVQAMQLTELGKAKAIAARSDYSETLALDIIKIIAPIVGAKWDGSNPAGLGVAIAEASERIWQWTTTDSWPPSGGAT